MPPLVTYSVSALLIVVAIQAVVIVLLLVGRWQRDGAELALRASEERFRLITEQVPVMVWTARRDATLDYLNGNCMKYTGMSREQMLCEGWLNAVHPDDLDHIRRSLASAVGAPTPFLMEYRVRGADGVFRWVLDSIVPRYAPDGSFAGFIGCTIDIDERRKAEDEILASRTALEMSHREIQHLAGRLIEAQDAERARIARDLHDDVSQQLAGMSIAFSALRQQVAASSVGDGLEEDLRALQQRTTALAQSVRHLSHDLHPNVLRHAGLVAALATYCAELERTHGTVFTFRAEGDFGSVAEQSSLCLYRMAQEALRNVIAHARAVRADVRLLRDCDIVEISITDDGRGFDVASSLERSNGLGLVSMTERARLARGTVNIESAPKKGTCVRARIPASVAVTADASAGAGGTWREPSSSTRRGR